MTVSGLAFQAKLQVGIYQRKLRWNRFCRGYNPFRVPKWRMYLLLLVGYAREALLAKLPQPLCRTNPGTSFTEWC